VSSGHAPIDILTAGAGGAKRRREAWYGRHVEVYALAAFVAILVAIAGLLSPSFLTAANIRDILTQAAPLCFVVMGQALVIMVRGLELSIASLMATVAVMATAFDAPSDVWIPIIFAAAALLCGVAGLINGLLVTMRNVSPFLATLAMMIVLQGLRFAYTHGAPAGTLPPGFRTLGTGQLLGVPINILVVIAFAVVLSLMLHHTPLGRRLSIVGGNPRAAELIGVSSRRVTLLAYVICAEMAGLGGLFLVGYVGTVDNWVGRGYELDSIVAAIIGGVALTGGSGTIVGALLGALVLIVIFNIVIILGLPVELQLIIKGVVIVLAAALHLRRVGTT
jgi:ribose/xylose/arabinose/galactoside ABC-type transport system permease subunit